MSVIYVCRESTPPGVACESAVDLAAAIREAGGFVWDEFENDRWHYLGVDVIARIAQRHDVRTVTSDEFNRLLEQWRVAEAQADKTGELFGGAAC